MEQRDKQPWKVTALYFRGFSHIQIAEKMNLAPVTVRNHMASYRDEHGGTSHAQLLGTRLHEFERFLVQLNSPLSILRQFYELFGNSPEIAVPEALKKSEVLVYE